MQILDIVGGEFVIVVGWIGETSVLDGRTVEAIGMESVLEPRKAVSTHPLLNATPSL